MRITIESVPHGVCRNKGVGDYGGSWCDLWIKVSHMRNWRYIVLVAVHELVEVAICRHQKITNRAITAFDKQFEAKRRPGNVDEPGNDLNAPYRSAHRTATKIEKVLAKALEVDWKQYSKLVDSL